MRFKITLTRIGKQCMLPIDYQYYISAWIYKVIDKADSKFAEFLHSEGYQDGNKAFKLFCYSPLQFGKPIVWKEKSLFEIRNQQLFLYVSFQLSDAAEKFIVGLFREQQVYVGDKFNGLDLAVSSVERLPNDQPGETARYKALSPIVISIPDESTGHAKYLSPSDNNYSVLVARHLISKYQTVPNHLLLMEDAIQFKAITEPRSKLITIKPYSPQQSKVRGFLYEFELTAPANIHELVLNAGFGEKNSTGFGWCEPL